MTATDIHSSEATRVDALSDLCADQLAERRNHAVIDRLFASPAGGWHLLAALVRGFDEFAVKVDVLDQVPSTRTRVTWLHDPTGNEGYAGGDP